MAGRFVHAEIIVVPVTYFTAIYFGDTLCAMPSQLSLPEIEGEKIEKQGSKNTRRSDGCYAAHT